MRHSRAVFPLFSPFSLLASTTVAAMLWQSRKKVVGIVDERYLSEDVSAMGKGWLHKVKYPYPACDTPINHRVGKMYS